MVKRLYRKIKSVGLKFVRKQFPLGPLPGNYVSRIYLNSTKNVPSDYPEALSEKEKAFLINSISSANSYMEFGAGASTFLATACSGIRKIYSVESDANWIRYLKKWKCIRNNVKKKRLIMVHENIGRVGDWGFPIDETRRQDYPNYSMHVWENDDISPDVIFIDGRFRVACAVSAAMNCSTNSVILIHDYSFRNEYAVVQEFLTELDRVDTMAKFSINADVSRERLQAIYELYKYNPE